MSVCVGVCMRERGCLWRVGAWSCAWCGCVREWGVAWACVQLCVGVGEAGGDFYTFMVISIVTPISAAFNSFSVVGVWVCVHGVDRCAVGRKGRGTNDLFDSAPDWEMSTSKFRPYTRTLAMTSRMAANLDDTTARVAETTSVPTHPNLVRFPRDDIVLCPTPQCANLNSALFWRSCRTS